MRLLILVLALGLVTSGTAFADMQLAMKKGCLTCHQADKKVVGPAYKDVAKKYKGDAGAETRLQGVLKKGGKDVWGKVPMPPHPQVSDDEARTLVKWILGL